MTTFVAGARHGFYVLESMFANDFPLAQWFAVGLRHRVPPLPWTAVRRPIPGNFFPSGLAGPVSYGTAGLRPAWEGISKGANRIADRCGAEMCGCVRCSATVAYADMLSCIGARWLAAVGQLPASFSRSGLAAPVSNGTGEGASAPHGKASRRIRTESQTRVALSCVVVCSALRPSHAPTCCRH